MPSRRHTFEVLMVAEIEHATLFGNHGGNVLLFRKSSVMCVHVLHVFYMFDVFIHIWFVNVFMVPNGFLYFNMLFQCVCCLFCQRKDSIAYSARASRTVSMICSSHACQRKRVHSSPSLTLLFCF